MAGSIRYCASIDWIEFEVQLSKYSNFWTVQEALKPAVHHSVTSYVKALDGSDGGAASRFRIRIQNPRRAGIVTSAVQLLREKFGTELAVITAVELAFDTYCAGAGIRQLAEIAADRFRFITAPPGDRWYFYRQSGEGRRYLDTLPQRRDIVEHFEKLWQLTDRHDKSVDVRYHAYVKTYDGGEPLLSSQHCARMEVTLSGNALPFKTLADLAQFNFAKVSKYFKFRRLAPNLHPSVKAALTTWLGRQLGKSCKYRRPVPGKPGLHSGTSVFRRYTVADEDLNAAAYECFRSLARKWRNESRRADFPEHLSA